MEEKEQLYEVDGKRVSKEELDKIANDPNKRLKKLNERVFKTLQKLFS